MPYSPDELIDVLYLNNNREVVGMAYNGEDVDMVLNHDELELLLVLTLVFTSKGEEQLYSPFDVVFNGKDFNSLKNMTDKMVKYGFISLFPEIEGQTQQSNPCGYRFRLQVNNEGLMELVRFYSILNI